LLEFRDEHRKISMTTPSDFKVLIVYPNLSMMLTPSYAVGLFTTILKKQGYVTDLFDCTAYLPTHEFMNEALPVTRANSLLNSRKFDPVSLWGKAKDKLLDDFRGKLEDFKPDAIIFSTLVEDTWPQMKDLLQVLHDYPEIPTITGGVFTTMAPELVIQHPDIQVIGTGEGEDVIVDFCEAVRTKGDHLHIPGTWAKEVDGNIIKNPRRSLVNINNTVADFSLFDDRRFLRPLGAKIWKAIPIETYRGCPYSCTFCNSPAQVSIAKDNGQGNYLRRKSMINLRHELDLMIERHHPDFFYINDDAFLARPKQEIADFVEMYANVKIPFWFQTRFEDVDADNLQALKDVGCYRISFGSEHGNENYRRDRLYRRISNEKILAKAEVVAQSGIPFTLNIIVGFPYETRELIFESIEFIRQIKGYDSLSVNVFVPYHGTVLRTMALKEGWLDPDRQTTSVIAESMLNMPPPYLSSDEILGLQRTMPLYAKLPKSRWEDIRKAERTDDEGKALFAELAKEFYEMTYGMDEESRILTYAG